MPGPYVKDGNQTTFHQRPGDKEGASTPDQTGTKAAARINALTIPAGRVAQHPAPASRRPPPPGPPAPAFGPEFSTGSSSAAARKRDEFLRARSTPGGRRSDDDPA